MQIIRLNDFRLKGKEVCVCVCVCECVQDTVEAEKNEFYIYVAQSAVHYGSNAGMRHQKESRMT